MKEKYNFDVVQKIDDIRIEKGWSVNKLATESMITQSTIANMFNTHAEPKISTLKAICDAFEISLSEFFYQGEPTEINPKTLNLLYNFEKLKDDEKNIIYDLIKIFNEK